MSSGNNSSLTAEEEYLLEKYRVLREKKKLLQRLKGKAAETKVKPAAKRELVQTASSTPEDAKKKAEMLVASGCVKISKSSKEREFKRARTLDKRPSKDNSLDQEATMPVETKQSTSGIAAMKDLYNSNFVKGGQSHDSDSHHGNRYVYREPKKGKTVFIKGHNLTEEIVQKEFHKYGTVTNVRFERDRKFGFVTYETIEQAEKTIEEMNGAKVAGLYVQVSFARKQFQNNDRGNNPAPLWSHRDKPVQDNRDPSKTDRELQRYGDGDDFF